MSQFAESTRNFIHEWSLNILILLFGTTTLVQAFIVPTPSMDSTVKVGDHLLVDKLSYAPAGQVRRHHRLPRPHRHPAKLRQARHRAARRSHPRGEQDRVCERQAAGRAL